ncbi:XRE family transcriptional regulator [Lactobacillus sp. XV13L]|nr:XRE family transcriptional regulator [Lactobacillus sp. XV13L]
MTTKKFNQKDYETGKTLRKMRTNQKLSIEQFSEIVQLSVKTIGNYERGVNTMSIASLVQIYRSHVFSDYSLTELFVALIASVYEEDE